MKEFRSIHPIVLCVAVAAWACNYPDPPGDDEIGDNTGDDSSEPEPDPASCESHSDCLHPGFPQCSGGECVPCNDGTGYCPSGYSCDSETGWCTVACPMDGSDPGDDDKEDNDTPETAAEISDLDDLSLWLCPGDVDYFEFGLNRDEVAYVSIIVNAKPFDGDMDLELTGPSMLSIKSESRWYGYPRAVEAIHTKITVDGTYTLKAHLANGVGGLPYRLQVRILRGPSE